MEKVKKNIGFYPGMFPSTEDLKNLHQAFYMDLE